MSMTGRGDQILNFDSKCQILRGASGCLVVPAAISVFCDTERAQQPEPWQLPRTSCFHSDVIQVPGIPKGKGDISSSSPGKGDFRVGAKSSSTLGSVTAEHLCIMFWGCFGILCYTCSHFSVVWYRDGLLSQHFSPCRPCLMLWPSSFMSIYAIQKVGGGDTQYGLHGFVYSTVRVLWLKEPNTT